VFGKWTTMITDSSERLSHGQVRRACGATGAAKEMQCPLCGHNHLQLFSTDEIKCQNGCDTGDVVAKVREILDTGQPTRAAAPKDKKPKPSELPGWQGYRLYDFCFDKKLDQRLMECWLNLKQLTRGKPVVGYPYYDQDGKTILATKIRKSADSHDCYFEPSDPHIPFGLNNPQLKNLVTKSYDLFITEGESDCCTLVAWGFLAIGVSGALGWRSEYADLPIIENAKRVLVCEDQDENKSGEKLSNSVLRDIPKAIIIRTSAKDISALHLKHYSFQEIESFSPHPFVQSIDIAIQAGTLEAAMRKPKTNKLTPAPMRDEAFYGLAGKIVKLLEPYLEADRPAILANVLALSAVLFKRNAYCKVAADFHYPCDYFLLVGTSSRARKGNTTNALLEVIERVSPGYRNSIITGLSTGQGLIKALIKEPSDPAEREKIEREKLPYDPIAPSVLIEISEFSELLAVMSRDENTLTAVMRNAWDGKMLAVTVKKDPLKVGNVSIANVSHITMSELKAKLTETDKANGFANRFLLIYSQRAKILPDPIMPDVALDEVVAELDKAVEASECVGLVVRDSDAKIIWDEEYKRLTDRGDSLIDTILGRAEAHVLRLSLLYALLDGSKEIKKVHLEAALAVWDYSEDSVKCVYGNVLDNKDQRILDALEKEPMTAGEIRRNVFHDHLTSTQVTERLEHLEAQRQVRRCEKKSGKGMVAAWERVW
jgi:hypothetical protein